MSRSRKFFEAFSGGNEELNEENNDLVHDVSQLTKMRTDPHDRFGRVLPGRQKFPVSAVKMLVGREGNYNGRGRFSSADCCHILSRCLPTNGPSKIDKILSCAYVSQFSEDGSLFVAGFEVGPIRIYDVDKGWKVKKDIEAKNLRSNLTDATLSTDQRFLVYSSLSPIVHIVDLGSAATESLANVTEIHEGLEIASDALDNDDYYSFRIFSVKFSKDGRELVAASNEKSIYVYDLEEKRLSLKIPAHESDVNAVCYADETGHLIYSGSDDNLCKVWDRRCLTARSQPAGILIGHLEGITFIDTRGDGHHLISNGKDQVIKLWDIRKMSSNVNYKQRPRYHDWDYQWEEYPEHLRQIRHPDDLSLLTYKGHSVLRTLIRCYFSPAFSTGQKYIYTGSFDGTIYIYDLVTGAEVARLKCHTAPVRDCNWHPYFPMLISSSWDGVIANWEFSRKDEEVYVPEKLVRRRKKAFWYFRYD